MKVPSTGVGYVPTAPTAPTTMLIAALPVWREDEDGVEGDGYPIR
jgi:hypothetical protein